MTGVTRVTGAHPAPGERNPLDPRDPAIGTPRALIRGGSLRATGLSSLYNESGEPRKDFALADLFGAHPAALPAKAAP